jgi:hypothetical protein
VRGVGYRLAHCHPAAIGQDGSVAAAAEASGGVVQLEGRRRAA